MSNSTTDSSVKKPIIEKKKKKKKRLIGFPGVIGSQLKPLNDSDFFKEKYAEDDFVILLIASDDRRAAVVTFKNGTIDVGQVKNKPEFIKPAKKDADGRIETDMDTFMKFSMGKVNPIKAVLTRKLKIRGVKKVLRFAEVFKILSFIEKQKRLAKEQAQ